MATSPAPDAAAPPGMCPGVAVLGGGGAGGDGDGSGKGGKDGSGGNGEGNGDGASGDGKTGGCAEGDPICPITGRMFLQIYDFGFASPFPLRFMRCYSSSTSNRDGEFGFGWSHAFGWRVRARRRCVEVYDGEARKQVFPALPMAGENVKNGLGWVLFREGDGLSLRIPGEGLIYRFGPRMGEWHNLVSVTDRNGNAITLQRDEKGVLEQITDSAGRPIRFTTDEEGRIIAAHIAIEPSHKHWMELARYTYDEEGNLASATDAEGYTANYYYDGHLLIEHRSVSGLSYCYQYDGKGADARCVESWGEYIGRIDSALEEPIPPRPEGRDTRKIKGIHHVRLIYEPSQRYTEVTNALGGVTRYFGDDLGRGVKIVDAAGGVTERAFDPATGGLLGQVGPDGAGPRIELDADGEITSIRPRAEDRVRGRFVDERGDEVAFDELRGGIERSRYDARGNLIFVQHADGTWEQFSYDERGLLHEYVNRQGAVSRIWHDPMGNCICIDHGGGRFEFSRYDYLGRRLYHIDPSQRVTEWAFDRRSEVVWKKLPDGTEVRAQYDANRRIVMLDEGGRVTRCEYGGMAWLTKMVFPGGETFEYRYDPMGNRTWMRNPRGQVFTLRRDQAGRCVSWKGFEGLPGAQGFDSGGKRAWLSSPLGRTRLEHNSEGELVAMELPGGQEIAFEYGIDGATKIDNGSVPLETEYDVMGRVARDRQGERELCVEWHGGEIAAIIPSESTGLPIGYHYDTLGGLEAVTVGRTRLELDSMQGDDFVDHLGDHLMQRRHYDAAGRLVLRALARRSLEVAAADVGTERDPGLISSTKYVYDRHGNLMREERSDGRSVEYEHTASNRVAEKRVWVGSKVVREEQLRYDAAGTVMLPGVRFDAAMRPIRLHNEEIEYDAGGRLARRHTDRGEWRYTWNDLDQLVRVEAPDRVVEMDYDAKGRRMKKRVYRKGTLCASYAYVWANNLLLHEIDELAMRTRTYFRRMNRWEVDGHVDVQGDHEQRVFYLLQPSGALDCAVDERGSVVWQAEQTLYGDAIDVSIDTAGVDARFANHFYDRDVELVYAVMRWYDPRLGLFVTADPAILDGNTNPRDYARNPLCEIDPCGLITTTNNPLPVPNAPGEVPPPTTGPGMTIPGNATGAPALSGPGGWAVGASGANGNPTPGYANCPIGAGGYAPGTSGALDQGSGFGSPNNPTSPQAIVNAAGAAYGCHTCGATNSGYTNPNHWTCDHQPPRSAFSGQGSANGGIAARGGAGPRARAESRQPGAVRLYPHCRNCSNTQRNALSAESSGGGTQAASRALGLMRQQV